MDISPDGRTDSVPFNAPRQSLLVAVPFYKNEHLVVPLLEALTACGEELRTLGAHVICYNDSPGYGALGATLAAMIPAAQTAFSCELRTNPANLGFVRTMNQAVAEAVARHADLLMLNSDTEPEPGAFSEMLRVAALDHMIGFVNPRSNNATIATLPLRYVPEDRDAARQAYRRLADMLPRVSYASTSIGFCMLVRWRVLAEFGGFDEIYNQGYNEENDLVMRAARCGFRAVLANHAFVWHRGEESFNSADTSRAVWEPANRAILDSRYPEYGPHTAAHHDAPETIAECLLAGLLPDAEGRIDIGFDFSTFRPDHNGTFQAGRQLLQAAHGVWGDQANLFVICSQEVYDFHNYAALGIDRTDPHQPRGFAAVFRVGQPYDWNVLQRLSVYAPVIGVYMLDTISIDCPLLTSPLLYAMWQFTLEHADLIVTQSRQTERQFRARFTLPDSTLAIMSHHSLDIADYALPRTAPQPPNARPRVLVLGNHFHHKYLSPTANALAAAFPGRDIVALGAPKQARGRADPRAIPPLLDTPNLIQVQVGMLSDAEIGAQYSAGDVVIFPSHAEGFGFPLLVALAARRPIFVRRLPVFEELWQETGHNPNVHFYDTTADLIERLHNLPAWIEAPIPAGNGSERSARELKIALDEAMRRADYHRIVRRLRAVQLASCLSHTNGHATAVDTAPAQTARYIAVRVENLLHRALTNRHIYRITRVLFHGVRAVLRFVRRALGK